MTYNPVIQEILARMKGKNIDLRDIYCVHCCNEFYSNLNDFKENKITICKWGIIPDTNDRQPCPYYKCSS